MKKISSFQIVSHGVDHSQYFTGVTTHGTKFDHVSLGVGMNEKEAFLEAIEMIDSEIDITIIPKNPKGINAKNKVPAKDAKLDGNELFFHVSILYNISETILIRVTNDGYLLGATSDLINGQSERYWSDYYEEGMSDYSPEIKEITVNSEIAKNLLKQGTSEQVYRDGYEAMNEAMNLQAK